MELYSIVLVVNDSQPSNYATVRITPHMVGFRWRGKTPVMEEMRTLPYLQLSISTNEYSNEVSQTHYDSVQCTHTEYIDNLKSQVDVAKDYGTFLKMYRDKGWDNPCAAINGFWDAMPSPVMGFVHAMNGDEAGNYEPMTTREVVDLYNKLANKCRWEAQARLDDTRYKTWEKNKKEDIARLENIIAGMGEITKAE